MITAGGTLPPVFFEVFGMKAKLILTAVLAAMILGGCSRGETQPAEQTTLQTEQTTESAQGEGTETEKQTVAPVEVGYEGMVPVYADELADGEYAINADSSSSMFNIENCVLTVDGGKMTAVLEMGGTGYECLFPGTSEQAEKASDGEKILPNEQNGVHFFTLPLEALDKEMPCAAFSKKKQQWYDRTLVFRADSLPATAFKDIQTVETLGLADGEYTAEVTLSGGSGRAGVQTPANITVTGGKALARIEWSSSNYDYMIVDDEKYLPLNTDGNSVFEIPVSVFGRPFAVKADTTAMSKPYEIDYTLKFEVPVKS